MQKMNGSHSLFSIMFAKDTEEQTVIQYSIIRLLHVPYHKKMSGFLEEGNNYLSKTYRGLPMSTLDSDHLIPIALQTTRMISNLCKSYEFHKKLKSNQNIMPSPTLSFPTRILMTKAAVYILFAPKSCFRFTCSCHLSFLVLGLSDCLAVFSHDKLLDFKISYVLTTTLYNLDCSLFLQLEMLG